MKKYILSTIAILMIVVLSAFAFSVKHDSKLVDPKWHYKLNTTTGENNPANYEPASGSESCPGITTVRCIIQAPDNGSGQPDLSHMTVLSKKF